VLDSRTGRKSQVDTSCYLEDRAPASAGRFLLTCGEAGQALVDVRSALVVPLPKPPPHEYGEYGPIWAGVGSHYVIGKAGQGARCHRTRRHESCTALYDIAKHALREVPETSVPDPDLPDAPPLCRALRRRVFMRSEFEELEGALGPLSPLASGFSYSDGVLALKKLGERRGKNILIDRCDGRASILPVPPERHVLETEARSLQLSAGALSWDTAHEAEAHEAEELEGPNGLLRHGTLTAYSMKTGRRRTWKLPVLPLEVIEAPTSGRPNHVVRGIFGYSAHTAHTIFWIRAESVSAVCGPVCTGNGQVSAVYAARF